MIKIEQKYSNSLAGLRLVDLFGGVGVFNLALTSFGAECVYASDIDKFVRETYWENFGLVPVGDITLIREQDVPAHNILTAGFPCVTFSMAGKQQGLDDPRGRLFEHVVRIAKYHQPEILFLENVKNLTSHNHGETLKTILKSFEDVGYNLFYEALNASNFGIPQHRERLYILGFHKKLKVSNFEFPKSSDAKVRLRDILLPCELEQVVQKKAFSHLAGTVRKLSPREYARLQGFPDSFLINQESPAQSYKQFGNSIVIDVVQHIILEIIKSGVIKKLDPIK